MYSDPYELQINFRAPPILRDRMTRAAEIYGGNMSDRIRLACIIHDQQATLVWLQLPQAAEQLSEEERAAAMEEVEKDLAETLAAAFSPRRTKANMN